LKPTLFIGSAREAIPIVQALEKNLQTHFNVIPWTNGIFKLGSTTLEDLLKTLDKSDFGIFLFTPDDASTIREKKYTIVRDNVIFELGLYIGRLGRKHGFILTPEKLPQDFHLASDLIGTTVGKFDNLKTSKEAILEFCKQLKTQIFNPEGFNLKGKWIFQWNVRSKRYPKLNIHNSELFHYENRVVGKYTSGDGHTYVFMGEIKNQYLTGFWHDEEGGPTYHGSFQVRIDPVRKMLSGVWTGWSVHGAIKSGKCRWVKKDFQPITIRNTNKKAGKS
jgi:hypothetical protein